MWDTSAAAPAASTRMKTLMRKPETELPRAGPQAVGQPSFWTFVSSFHAAFPSRARVM